VKETFETSTKKKRKIQINRVKTKKQKLLKIWNTIEKSTDKLFFISRHEPGQIQGEWHLVQIDEDGTNKRAAK
jgi:hypothetical protein